MKGRVVRWQSTIVIGEIFKTEAELRSPLAFMVGLFFECEVEGGSSETSVDFQRTTRHYISEDSTLHNHRCENLILILFKT
jgi:hypothetical protein